MEHSKFHTKLRIRQFTLLAELTILLISVSSSFENSCQRIIFKQSIRAARGEAYFFSSRKSHPL